MLPIRELFTELESLVDAVQGLKGAFETEKAARAAADTEVAALKQQVATLLPFADRPVQLKLDLLDLLPLF